MLNSKGFTTEKIDDLGAEVQAKITELFGSLGNNDDTGIKESDFNLVYEVISTFFYGTSSASDAKNEPTKPDRLSVALGYLLFANFVAWLLVAWFGASGIMLIVPMSMITATLLFVGLKTLNEKRG